MITGMGYELGLIATVAISGWITLDLAFAPRSRRPSLALAGLALAGGLWAAGDLLLLRALDPAAHLFARRVVYLGVCALPICWLATSLEAARPEWSIRAGRWLMLLALPSAVFYSCLYWDSGAWFTDWSVTPPRRGPLFVAHTLWAWALVAIGCTYFARVAVRLRKASATRMAALGAGTLAPLLGNAFHLTVGAATPDPTPVLLGLTGLVVRLALVDSGLALSLPLARSDVVEQLDVGILVADLAGRVVDANQAARRLVGQGDPTGQPLEHLTETVRARADAMIEVRSFSLHSAVAEVGRAALFVDRTEARTAQRRLELAARLEALGLLTAGIAHEVNNPLAFIRANLSHFEKLSRELADPVVLDRLPSPVGELVEEAPDLVAETLDGVERIAQLVSRLKRFAREDPERRGREPVDLGRVADTAVSMAGVGLPRGSIRRIVRPVPAVRAVETDLVQIALNLLVNAVQASPEPVAVEIEVAPRDGGAALSVRDRGPGIPQEVFPRIFDAFFTTKPPGTGTGLGLSLSYDLARRNDGRLEAANRKGGGAEFTLWLPVPPEPAPG
jgi:signal transduction histidine kinase